MSVNCTDMLGRSAIQIAVDNENTELVELLLMQDGVKIGDALLYAIREGVYKIVEVTTTVTSRLWLVGQEWDTCRCREPHSSQTVLINDNGDVCCGNDKVMAARRSDGATEGCSILVMGR